MTIVVLVGVILIGIRAGWKAGVAAAIIAYLLAEGVALLIAS
jgi:hypothetical protein